MGWNGARSDQKRIEDALSQGTEIEFTEMPLTEALRFLSDLHNITIVLSPEADAGDPVTMVLSGVSLRTALDRLLRPRKLRFQIADGVLQVSPAEPSRK